MCDARASSSDAFLGGGSLLVWIPMVETGGAAVAAASFITTREFFEGLEWHEGINLRGERSADGSQ